VTFSTDVFHPLLTPLTTYTYTTGSSDTDTVSATDEERLPPGGFSLRHGFPHWFGRARRSAASSRNVSGSSVGTPSRSETPVATESKAVIAAAGGSSVTRRGAVSVAAILGYIQSTFCDEAILDSIPLEAAANPGAYHAWRTYRVDALQSTLTPPPISPSTDSHTSSVGGDAAGAARARRPGEWNWEGVWEERVRKAVKASLSEAVLYGTPGVGEDMVVQIAIS
jgi:hypothetical protein